MMNRTKPSKKYATLITAWRHAKLDDNHIHAPKALGHNKMTKLEIEENPIRLHFNVNDADNRFMCN